MHENLKLQSGKVKIPRISDVAGLAGVSIATVSRTLSHPDMVSAEARARVQAAIQSTGYSPNPTARALRGAGGNLALVVVPNLITPFFSELLQHIDRALSRRGFALLVGNLDDDGEKAQRLADLAYGGQVAGAILLNGSVLCGRRGLVGNGILPAVAVSQPFDRDIPSMLLDESHAIGLAFDHLSGLGHRWLGYLSGPARDPVDDLRWRALQTCADGAGGPKPVRFEGDFEMGSGVDAANAYLAMPRHPTAIVAASDAMAIGFISAVHAAGLDVPGDVSVTGFDGIAMADIIQPHLTTVIQPQIEIAEYAVAALAAQIKGRTGVASRVLRAQLRIGGSTSPPRRSFDENRSFMEP
ncbi:MAG: LacI family DNA-binding transcriptional regulator [Geminicoccaceae bacterium]|nr:LacI family DNA-binding transcriptional regulator [Geminicoccaceae bacterium]